MTIIRQQDLIDSIEDALQYISFYHPLDFVQALEKAYHREESKAAKDVWKVYRNVEELSISRSDFFT